MNGVIEVTNVDGPHSNANHRYNLSQSTFMHNIKQLAQLIYFTELIQIIPSPKKNFLELMHFMVSILETKPHH